MTVSYKGGYGLLVKLEVVDCDENCDKFTLVIFDKEREKTIIYENVDITDIIFSNLKGIKFA